jgi:DNA invertase Pin-like site-specific DNA recombinase
MSLKTKQHICYIRTSTSEQTPQLQLKDIKTICPPHTIEYVEQLSAWKENVKRPVFEQIVEQIKGGRVESLYVWDWDRIYRNRNRLKEFLLLCKMNGVVLHSYRQTWFEDLHRIPPPFNEIVMDMVINLLGWIGEEESEKKSSRVKMAVKKTAKGTYSHNGNKWGRKAFPKQTINRVIELHQQGKSIRQIASEVIAYDTNKNEKKISKSAVQQILSKSITLNCPEIVTQKLH